MKKNHYTLFVLIAVALLVFALFREDVLSQLMWSSSSLSSSLSSSPSTSPSAVDPPEHIRVMPRTPSPPDADVQQHQQLSSRNEALPHSDPDLAATLKRTLDWCNSDLHNNPNRRQSCILLRNAAVFPDGSVMFAQEDNAEFFSSASNNNGNSDAGNKKKHRPLELFPSSGSDRYFLRAAALRSVSRESLFHETQMTTTGTHVGLFTHNYIGAAFDNVWHTLSDFAVCIFDTLVPIFDSSSSGIFDAASSPLRRGNSDHLRAPVTWLTFPPAFSNYRDRTPCATEHACRSKVLFELFDRIFSRIHFVISDASVSTASSGSSKTQKPLRFPYLLVGSATACSPVKTEGVGTDRCKSSLRKFRDHILTQLKFDPERRAFDETDAIHKRLKRLDRAGADADDGRDDAHEEKMRQNPAAKLRHLSELDRVKNEYPPLCPQVHLMSRQRAFYRKMHPWTEIVAQVQHVISDACTAAGRPFRDTTEAAAARNLAVVELSSTTSLREQIASVAKTDIFIAGRGGGTGLCIFLPLNATYISVSLSDRWNPYRDLEPPWLRIRHFEATAVHHLDPSKKPRLSKGRVDANQCDYKVDPSALANELKAALWASV